MSKQDNKILENGQGRYPFRTPSDSYFDDFTARIMAQIPIEEESVGATEQNARESVTMVTMKPKPHLNRWLTISGIAASFLIVVTVTLKTVYDSNHSEKSAKQTEQIANVYNSESYEYGEDEYMMEYCMIDNSDVYDYLCGTN